MKPSRLLFVSFALLALAVCCAGIPRLQALRVERSSAGAMETLGGLPGAEPPEAGLGPGAGGGLPAGAGPDPAEKPDPETFRTRHPELYGVTAPPEEPVRLVAEFEPVDTVYVTWRPGYGDGFFAALTDVLLTRSTTRVVLIHNGGEERRVLEIALRQRGLRPQYLTFLDAKGLGPWFAAAPDAPLARAVQTPWLRDWGPFFVEVGAGRLAVVDTRYQGERVNDDALPTKLAAVEGLPVYRPELMLEGGNLLTDGAGTCFVATPVESQSEELSGLEDEQLHRYLGCKKLVWLQALSGEETGHVDMFLKVAPGGVLLLGTYAPEQDPQNSRVLNENDAVLRTLEGADGVRFRVLRVPMPDNGDGIFRTYLNGLVVNDVVLLPSFEGYEHLEPAARAAYRAAYPGATVIGIPVDDIVGQGGAIHCATQTRPTLAHRKSPGHALGAGPGWPRVGGDPALARASR